ncbi:hypothetical protein ES708_22737 [subsurface metagenome]
MTKEPKLKLNMDFEEALKRFTSVDKKELEKELEKCKEEKEKSKS